MFNTLATRTITAFNNAPFSRDTIRPMSNDFDRLLRAAKALHPKAVKDKSSLARFLQRIPQDMTNWAARGIPKGELTEVARRVGCDVNWLELGDGDMTRGVPLAELLARARAAIAPDRAEDCAAAVETMVRSAANILGIKATDIVEDLSAMRRRVEESLLGVRPVKLQENHQSGLGQAQPDYSMQEYPGANRRIGAKDRRKNN